MAFRSNKRENAVDKAQRLVSEGHHDALRFDAHDRTVENGTAPTHCGQVAEYIGDGTYACETCHTTF